jgi:hypothetical protein
MPGRQSKPIDHQLLAQEDPYQLVPLPSQCPKNCELRHPLPGSYAGLNHTADELQDGCDAGAYHQQARHT